MTRKSIDQQDFLVQPLEEHHLEAVVSIHQSVLGYTMNSRLGEKHLMLLYGVMSKSPDSFVAVALHNSRPVGFVSGTLDIESVQKLFVQSAPFSHWITIAACFLFQPGLILDWMRGSQIGKPVFLNNNPVEPILTTIGIDEHFQGLGIGKELVYALEKFFLAHRVPAYRLDTLESNQQARTFYSAMGFFQLEERAGSVILIKNMGNNV